MEGDTLKGQIDFFMKRCDSTRIQCQNGKKEAEEKLRKLLQAQKKKKRVDSEQDDQVMDLNVEQMNMFAMTMQPPSPESPIRENSNENNTSDFG